MVIILLWLFCNIIRKFNYICMYVLEDINLYILLNKMYVKKFFLMFFFDCKYLYIIRLLFLNDLEFFKYLKSDINVVYLIYFY